jgi:hypothetical protein
MLTVRRSDVCRAGFFNEFDKFFEKFLVVEKVLPVSFG